MPKRSKSVRKGRRSKSMARRSKKVRSRSVVRKGRRRSRSVVRRRRKSRSRSRRRSRYSSWDRRNQLSEVEVSAIAEQKQKNLFQLHQLNPSTETSYMPEKKAPICSMLEHEFNHVKGHKCALQKKGYGTAELVSRRDEQLMRGMLKGIKEYHYGLRCEDVTRRKLKHECPR